MSDTTTTTTTRRTRRTRDWYDRVTTAAMFDDVEEIKLCGRNHARQTLNEQKAALLQEYKMAVLLWFNRCHQGVRANTLWDTNVFRIIFDFLFDTRGESALHIAAQLGNKPATQALLRLGCDPTLPNRDGVTARELAAANRNVDVLELINNSMTNSMTGIYK